MSIAVIQPQELDAPSQDFLKNHDAVDDFGKLCEIVRECFPQLVRLDTRLEQDVYEAWRVQLVLVVCLPVGCSFESLKPQQAEYYQRYLETVPRSKIPLFNLTFDFLE